MASPFFTLLDSTRAHPELSAVLKISSVQVTALLAPALLKRRSSLVWNFWQSIFLAGVPVSWSTPSPKYAHSSLSPEPVLTFPCRLSSNVTEPSRLSFQPCPSSAGPALRPLCPSFLYHLWNSLPQGLSRGEHFSLASLAHLTMESRMPGT